MRPRDHGLKPFQPLEPSRPVDARVRRAGGAGGNAGRPQHRLHCRARPPLCPRRKGGAKVQAIGRPRGGPGTKIHALTDACGRPAAFSLTPANDADITAAPGLLDQTPPPARLIADKGYDAGHLRDRLAATGTQAVIPSRRSRKTPIPHDETACRRRNRIERTFGRLKDWRRIATRYDKLARNFAAAVAIAAIVIWWT
jgi:transposase